jgi:hypothetical protein
MRRTILLAGVAVLALAFMAQPAAAGWGPPMPYQGSALEYGCGFGVQLDAVGSVIDHEWFDAEGNYRLIENGPRTTLTATNVATGTSITVRYNGALLYWQDPEDTVWTQTATGPWVWTADPASYLEGPGLWYSTGRISWSGYEPMTYSQGGRLIDLCPILAS